MAILIKQSTAVTVVLGPFVDSTDGVTAETALTISQADVRLSKNAGTFAQKNETSAATHMENGYYSVPLNTTDTNTLGVLRIAVNETGALPVWLELMVLPANVYDSLVLGTDNLDIEIATVASAAQSVIADAVWDEPVTEPSAIFAWSGTMRNIFNWLGALARNRMVQTSTETTLRNDANSADIATSAISDDGTEFVRSEWT